MWKGITILFTIIVFAGFNAFAKSEPLRYFLLYSIPGPHPERYEFCDNSIEKEKRDLRIGQLLKAMTAPVNQDIKHIKFDGDSKQEYRKQLLQEGVHVALYINENKNAFMKPTLPLEILNLLGEIHAPISFSLLLENYALAPDFRSAITLACCTDFDYNVRTLFSTLTSKKLLDKYLKDVLTNIPGGYWEKIEKLPPDQQQLFYKKNLEDIRNKAIERAKPILG